MTNQRVPLPMEPEQLCIDIEEILESADVTRAAL